MTSCHEQRRPRPNRSRAVGAGANYCGGDAVSQSQKESKVIGYVLVKPNGELADTTLISKNPEYLLSVYTSSLTAGYRIAKVCEAIN